MFDQTMRCKYCDSVGVVRYGSQSGHPRCRCNQCRRTFQVSYTYRAYAPGVKNQIVDLTMKGRGVGNPLNLLIL
jgi:transposase-like protein